ncbi:DUF4870 domain-containing protein [Kocuria oceani]|uniref:DUF4870 domain-containing protein n=1 Tax=Kocuria oceani TaxID=988827 RepID=A0ABV9TFG9_9MICC|nr:DUF4870 domain-containing protein [Kocuria oceani]
MSYLPPSAPRPGEGGPGPSGPGSGPGYDPGPSGAGHGYGPGGPAPQYRAQGDDRTIAILTHLSGLVGALISVGWLGFVGPLVVWLVHKDRNAFLRATAAGSFNFNLSMWLLNAAAWVCLFTVILFPVAIVLWLVAAVLLVVCHVLAVLKANKGEVYRYPLQLPVLR